jgi:hypothetical protein
MHLAWRLTLVGGYWVTGQVISGTGNFNETRGATWFSFICTSSPAAFWQPFAGNGVTEDWNCIFYNQVQYAAAACLQRIVIVAFTALAARRVQRLYPRSSFESVIHP